MFIYYKKPAKTRIVLVLISGLLLVSSIPARKYSVCVTVLKTDTGKQVENTKACEKTILKELCKMTAVTSGEGGP